MNIQDRFAAIIRPLLTLLGFGCFMGVGIWGLYISKLAFSDFFNIYGPITSMMVGYWFAKRETKDSKDD